MLGFVKSEKDTRTLGGEVIRLKKRRLKVFLIVLMLIGFILINIILYLMSGL
jgi:predicted nucleic acid-binding Zn ribbon protein